jgi:AcrR family transcriptional regulator
VGETSVTASTTGARDDGRVNAGDDAAPPATDGRVTRAARTRQAVVDALLTLNERGELRPTARDIAAEAGVSLRSLYVHFDDLEALIVESSRRYNERLLETLPPVVAEGPVAERLDAFLARRVQIHEFAPGVRRAALLQEPFSPVLQKVLTQGRKALRAEAATAFGPELAAVDGDEMPLLRALDLGGGVQAWEMLRVHHGLSVEEATDQVRAMLLAFVRAWAPSADPACAESPAAEAAHDDGGRS